LEVRIKGTDKVVRFPDNMSIDEIKNALYSHTQGNKGTAVGRAIGKVLTKEEELRTNPVQYWSTKLNIPQAKMQQLHDWMMVATPSTIETKVAPSLISKIMQLKQKGLKFGEIMKSLSPNEQKMAMEAINPPNLVQHETKRISGLLEPVGR